MYTNVSVFHLLTKAHFCLLGLTNAVGSVNIGMVAEAVQPRW